MRLARGDTPNSEREKEKHGCRRRNACSTTTGTSVRENIVATVIAVADLKTELYHLLMPKATMHDTLRRMSILLPSIGQGFNGKKNRLARPIALAGKFPPGKSEQELIEAALAHKKVLALDFNTIMIE